MAICGLIGGHVIFGRKDLAAQSGGKRLPSWQGTSQLDVLAARNHLSLATGAFDRTTRVLVIGMLGTDLRWRWPSDRAP
jgi:hypothetical protein